MAAQGVVGIFAVQLARLHGAYVVATASANLALVKGLGADEVIDYKAVRFDEVVKDVDVVFVTVGDETRERSRPLRNPGSRMVTIAADGEVTTDPKVRATYFIVEPSQQQPNEVTKLIEAGKIRTIVNAVVPLAKVGVAYAGNVPARLGYGKVVVRISEK